VPVHEYFLKRDHAWGLAIRSIPVFEQTRNLTGQRSFVITSNYSH